MRPILLPGILLAGAVLLLLGSPRAGAAQEELGTQCDLQDFRVVSSQEILPGRRVTWIGRPLLVCPDGLRIRADSAVVYEETGRNHLIGQVHVQTPDRELRSEEADYFEMDGRLHARGAVEFQDRARGTEIRGDTLLYLEVTEQRPEDEVEVRGRPATAVVPREDLPEGEVDDDPLWISGTQLRFVGDRFLWADGDVEMLRRDMRATADSAAFERPSGELTLRRQARVDTDDATFQGGRIVMVLPDDVLESVTIRDRGRLWTEDLDLWGEEIRIYLEDEKIHHLVSVDRPPPEEDVEEERPPRPRAEAPDFVLVADSLDIRSPDQILEVVYAVGTARAETRDRTAAAHAEDAEAPMALEELEDLLELPEEEEEEDETLRLPDRDYMEGDEIVATFVRVEASVEPTGPSEAEREYRLDRLEALGNARSLYRSPPEQEEGAPAPPMEDWSVSYILADRIAIFLMEGEMDRMEAEGDVRILHLEPRSRDGERTAQDHEDQQ